MTRAYYNEIDAYAGSGCAISFNRFDSRWRCGHQIDRHVRPVEPQGATPSATSFARPRRLVRRPSTLWRLAGSSRGLDGKLSLPAFLLAGKQGGFDESGTSGPLAVSSSSSGPPSNQSLESRLRPLLQWAPTCAR